MAEWQLIKFSSSARPRDYSKICLKIPTPSFGRADIQGICSSLLPISVSCKVDFIWDKFRYATARQNKSEISRKLGSSFYWSPVSNNFTNWGIQSYLIVGVLFPMQHVHFFQVWVLMEKPPKNATLKSLWHMVLGFNDRIWYVGVWTKRQWPYRPLATMAVAMSGA